MIGGSCINVACIPTKTLVQSAKVAELVRRAAQYGIETIGTRVDMEEVRRHKRGVVEAMITANHEAFDASGLDLIIGDGRFLGPRTLEVKLASGNPMQLKSMDEEVIEMTRQLDAPEGAPVLDVSRENR